ncbi:Acylphosphatase-like domain-containing protein [Entophlyctis helioformis]|nr:Acylphosphatase-like domain-containing protein [Entophlyctis helioformis]
MTLPMLSKPKPTAKPAAKPAAKPPATKPAVKQTVFHSKLASSAAQPTTTSTIAYRVTGKVQGVFFRKHTHKTAQSLGLVGTVQNAPDGSVVGVAQGPSPAIAEFKTWLSSTGSPKSRIDSAQFNDTPPIAATTFAIIR